MRQLEGKLTQLAVKLRQEQTKTAIEIPPSWSDFVSRLKIISGGQVLFFDPYPYQRALVKTILKYPSVDILKTRQMGITETVLSFVLWLSALDRSETSLLFMPTQPGVTSMSDRLREMLRGNPYKLRAETENVTTIRLDGGGWIGLRNSSKVGSRGLPSVTNLIFDEAAFNPNIADIYGAASATTSMLGNSARRIVLSTPDVATGWFFDRITDQVPDLISIAKRVTEGTLFTDGIPGFYVHPRPCGLSALVFIHWLAHPFYSQIDKEYEGGYLKYRKDLDGIEDWNTIFREYGLSFSASVSSVFQASQIIEAATGVFERPRMSAEDLFDRCYYMIGIDPVGQGSDYLALTVVKRNPAKNKYKIVFIHREKGSASKIETKIKKCIALIKQWRPKTVVVENIGVGAAWGDRIQKGCAGLGSRVIEHATTQRSKVEMVAELDLLLNSRLIELPKRHALIEELQVFSRFGDRMSAPNGKHDDCVMSLLLALRS